MKYRIVTKLVGVCIGVGGAFGGCAPDGNFEWSHKVTQIMYRHTLQDLRSLRWNSVLPRGAITSTSATSALLNTLGHRSLLSKYDRVVASQNMQRGRDACHSSCLISRYVYSAEVGGSWKGRTTFAKVPYLRGRYFSCAIPIAFAITLIDVAVQSVDSHCMRWVMRDVLLLSIALLASSSTSHRPHRFEIPNPKDWVYFHNFPCWHCGGIHAHLSPPSCYCVKQNARADEWW